VALRIKVPTLPVQPGVAATWGRFGAAYDAVFTVANHEVARVALERSGLRPGMSVLDIAAGGGALSIPAARLGADVLATDVAPAMLELLDQRASAAGLSIRTAVMDGTRLDVGDQCFDRVCSEFGVMFFPDEGLPEMRRVMAQEGKAIVIIWGYPDDVALSLYRLSIERALGVDAAKPEVPLVRDPGGLEPALRRAGFGTVELFSHTESLPATSGEDVWAWMSGVSPGYATFLAGLPDDQRARVHEALLELTEARYGSAFESLPMEMICAIASD
jgi:SAM-dependent methyltransferase